MRDAAPQVINLKDYTPPAFLISTVALDVDIQPARAMIHATLKLARNPARGALAEPLVLDGADFDLLRVAIDGRALGEGEYLVDEAHLTIAKVPDAFTLETVVRFDPWKNIKLEGLYATKSGLVTQCEAEGFRRITYFIDRPDVMATYAVTLCADKALFPQLLANGNLISSAEGEPAGWFASADAATRHWARWEDPFPKPCYLFAMVAASLELLEDHFATRSGKKALLQIYVEPGKLDQAGFAMQALKKCMRWDEEVFGLELDLERFMIVAVSDFNAGAMENKGLNIFNTKYILARSDAATDYDYFAVDKVVAHEYFHNWTGNRVTCRDWFQLSLKEGLTVYRDQEYSAQEYSRPVVRIQEVRDLRNRQFPEDAGPMAHPVRPESYVEVNNFYTATVYDKGAEVVRMYATILGRDGFRRGMDLYFKRHDGQAVTCDDFRKAMSDANGIDLSQFERWYAQAGTPLLECRGEYDGQKNTYTLHVKQSCLPTPGQPVKEPFVIPLAVGLVDLDGHDLPLHVDPAERYESTPVNGSHTAVLAVTRAEHRFVFSKVPEDPVPSLLRGFSAPVHVRYEYSDSELTHLMAYDADAFNRWEAGQALAIRILLGAIESVRAGRPMDVPPAFIEAMGRVISEGSRDPAASRRGLSRGMHGCGRPRRDSHRSHAPCPRDRNQIPDPLRGCVPALRGTRPVFARHDRRGAAGVAQCRAVIREHHRRWHVAGPGVPRVPARREHDRCDGRPHLPREFRGRGARARAGDVLREVEGRSARRGQVVSRAGDLMVAGNAATREGAHHARGLRYPESESRAVPPARVRSGQSAAFPCGRRQRLPMGGGTSGGARSPQPPGRLAARARVRPLEEIRCRSAGACAQGARADSRLRGSLPQRRRGRGPGAGVVAARQALS